MACSYWELVYLNTSFMLQRRTVGLAESPLTGDRMGRLHLMLPSAGTAPFRPDIIQAEGLSLNGVESWSSWKTGMIHWA